VGLRKRGVREEVVFGRFELSGDLRRNGLELVHNGPELVSGAFRVGLGEDRADQRCDDRPLLVFRHGQQVSHGVNPAALPTSVLEHPPNRGLESSVRVGDHESNAVKVPVDQRAEELGPERLVLGVTNINTQHLTVPVSTKSGGDHNSFGDDLAALADMDVGGVQPEVDERLMAQITVPEHCNVSVDVFADPRHRRLRNASVAAECFDEVVDFRVEVPVM
jgi:hypothetical protein